MPLIKSLALILRSRPYRETSIMFTAITPEFGTLHFIGKGFREKHHGFGAPFEPLTLLEAVFYERTRSDLQLLKEIDIADSFPALRRSVRAYAYGCYFAEAVGQLVLEGHREISLFSLLMEALRRVDEGDNERLLETFQVKILAAGGFLPQLYSCVRCGSEELSECCFDYEQGGVSCRRCALRVRVRLPISKGTLETMRYLSEEPFEKAFRLKTGLQTHAELKGILRRFIAYRLEGELRTVPVLDQLQRYKNPAPALA